MASRYAHIINERRIIDGPKNDLMAISPMKHVWAKDFWEQMIANTWMPTEVKLGDDIACYKNGGLDADEKRAYDLALAFVSNLDGIQLHNLTDNISRFITSPEVKLVMTRQAFEEAVHVFSYSTLAEAIVVDPMEVYMTFERDSVLAAKNEMILTEARILGTSYSRRTFALAVVSNIILEGVYFYTAFLTFYTLARRGMNGTADMIRFIQRDEVCHLNFFVHIFKTLQEEYPEIFDESFYRDATELFEAGARLEGEWGVHIIGKGILGLTPQIVRDYPKHRANVCAELIGMKPIYPGLRNPCEWVDSFSDINGEEKNFFEGRNMAYQVGTLDFDDL